MNKKLTFSSSSISSSSSRSPSNVGARQLSKKSSRDTCSLSLDVEVRLIVRAGLNDGVCPVPDVCAAVVVGTKKSRRLSSSYKKLKFSKQHSPVELLRLG